MGPKLITFRIKEGPNYDLKRIKLVEAVRRLAPGEVFDEMTSYFIFRHSGSTQEIVALLAGAAGLDILDTIAGFDLRETPPAVQGYMQSEQKLRRIVSHDGPFRNALAEILIDRR